jgi:hypothetical protein
LIPELVEEVWYRISQKLHWTNLLESIIWPDVLSALRAEPRVAVEPGTIKYETS